MISAALGFSGLAVKEAGCSEELRPWGMTTSEVDATSHATVDLEFLPNSKDMRRMDPEPAKSLAIGTLRFH